VDDALSTMLFVLAAAAVGLVMFYRQGGTNHDPLARMRATTELTFKRLKLDASKPEYSFNGRTAEVIKVDDEVFYQDHVPTGMALHIYARNPQGEYFYVIARSYDSPFVKHISHASTKAVLKGKYVETSA
jgi:hypothetical protein